MFGDKKKNKMHIILFLVGLRVRIYRCQDFVRILNNLERNIWIRMSLDKNIQKTKERKRRDQKEEDKVREISKGNA